jgi:hypothetical protein
MSDEGLLITSTSGNKRSITEHFVDYVKKTKCFAPCNILPKENSSSTKRGISLEKNLHFHHSFSFVPGSLCMTYSISNDDHTENAILTLHGKDLFIENLSID